MDKPLLKAAIEYQKRRSGDERPDGKWSGPRWTPSDAERLPCCQNPEAHPGKLSDLYEHCKGLRHLSRKYGANVQHILIFNHLLYIYDEETLTGIEQRLIAAITVIERSTEKGVNSEQARKMADAILELDESLRRAVIEGRI